MTREHVSTHIHSIISTRWRRPFLWALSWVIVAFGQPSWNPIFPVLASVCGYAFFWLTLTGVSRKRRFYESCFWFMCVQAIQLSWMTATAYHGWYILVVYLAVLFWFGIQFGILALCLPLHLKPSFLSACALAGVWTLLEWSRLFVFCGFPFNMNGIALSGLIVSAQLAAVLGVLGLSFLVMLVNLIGLKAFQIPKRKYLGRYAGVLIGIYAVGAVHLGYHTFKMHKEHSNYEVALVQTGLRPEEKVPLNGKTHLFISPFDQWIDILSYLKEQQRTHFDLIVLPEAALPYGAYQDIYSIEEVCLIFEKVWGPEYYRYLPVFDPQNAYVSNAFWAQAIANYYQSELIIGLDDYDMQLKSSYNAAFHFFPYTMSGMRYEKCILVPLAEYLPIKMLEPLVSKYGIFEFSTHGAGSKVFGNKVPIAISICYEECFGNLIRQGKLKGARLLVNVTNDGWYLPSRLPEQHFYHGRLRSIENGVPLLRACNTGITAAVDSVGHIAAQLHKADRGVLVTSIPLYHYKTLYTLCGDMPIIAVSLVSILAWAMSRKFLSKRLTISTSSG
jgi:apolipoprotein N-acyltransferase